MKQEVEKIAKMLNSVLNQQGYNVKRNAIFQALEDFEISTSNTIKKDLDNNDYEDIKDLSIHVNTYIDVKKLIKQNSNDKNEFKNAVKNILNVYNYYESKYIRELAYRNSDQRRNYIETILSPLILISLFFEEELQKN